LYKRYAYKLGTFRRKATQRYLACSSNLQTQTPLLFICLYWTDWQV